MTYRFGGFFLNSELHFNTFQTSYLSSEYSFFFFFFSELIEPFDKQSTSAVMAGMQTYNFVELIQ